MQSSKLWLALLVVLQGPVWAAEPAALIVRHYLDRTPIEQFDTAITLEQAMAVQEEVSAELSKTLGPVVGYKAGLTNPALQERFGVAQPLRGVLLEKMLLPSGAVLPARFGAVPMSEGDLLVRVRSEAINEAATPAEALAAIDAVLPFIELPDLLFAPTVKPNAPALAAVGIAARYGIVGEPIEVQATPEWQDRLRDFQLLILDGAGRILAEGRGSHLLGHPLNVVLWLKESLRRDGKRLRAGDLLSLGTVTSLLPVAPATTLRARYLGLDPRGPVEISVRFE